MLKTRYGLTPTDYAEMMRLQCGVCAVCGAPERWLHVDHDHQTGQVRALLCGNCNRALGLLNEEPERIGALAAYASGIHGGGDKEEDE